MRNTLSLLVVGFVCSIVLLGAQDGSRDAENRIVGTWAGTWDGQSSGDYTMSIEHDDAKELGGTVTTMPNSGLGYEAILKSIVVDEAKVTIQYSVPSGEDVELVGTVEGETHKGTWKAFNPGTTTVVARGTFKGSKK